MLATLLKQKKAFAALDASPGLIDIKELLGGKDGIWEVALKRQL